MTSQHPYTALLGRIAPLLVGAALAFAPAGVRAQPPARAGGLTPEMITDFGGVKHVTRARFDATMGFSLATRVTEVLVKNGQEVKAGDLLVRGEDAEEAVFVKLQKLRATTDLPVQKAAKGAELAKLEYEKLKEAQQKSGASPLEVDRARLTWEGAEIDLGTARISQEQEVLQVERYQARVDKLQLKAPFDGQVDSVNADAGQSVSENDKVLRIVNVEALRIDVPAPTSTTLDLALKVGDPAWVLMDLPGEPRVYEAVITGLSAVADSASATRSVRVELPNPTRIVAGVNAWVRFREPTGAWKERIVRSKAASVQPVTEASK